MDLSAQSGGSPNPTANETTNETTVGPSAQSGGSSNPTANDVALAFTEDNEEFSMARTTMQSTTANSGSKLPAYQRQQLSSTEEADTMLRQLHGVPTRRTHYIWHPGPSLNESQYVWYDDEKALVRFCAFASEDTDMTILSCKDNNQNKTASQLLDNFCQRVDHPTTVDELNFTLIAMLTGFLLQSYDGSKFSKVDKIWGIKGIAEVDRNKQLKVLMKKFGENGAEIVKLGNEIVLHKDEGMVDRGLLNYSIVGEAAGSDFAFVVIVDINHDDYIETFEHQAPAFDIILALGCLNFYRARTLFADPAYQTEAARLRRQIGAGAFHRLSRPMGTVEDGEGVEVGEDSTSPHRQQPRKKQKNKKRKQKKKAAVDEAEEEDEVAGPSMVVDDAEPTTTTATATASPPVASSPLPPPPPPPIDVFTFSHPNPLLTCAHPGCNGPTHTTEGRTVVICPRCTPYSSIRYCKADHLLDPAAMRAHFLASDSSKRCGLTSLLFRPVDDTPTSIPDSCLPPHPYIHEEISARTANFPKNIIERHRQAVWRSMRSPTTTECEPRTDYHIFNDLDQIHNRLGITPLSLQAASSATAKGWLNQVRGLGEMVVRISIFPTATTRIFTDGALQIVNLREKFNEAVDTCLRLGFAAGTLAADDCMFVYTVVRSELRNMGIWDACMCEALVVQLGFEFGWSCPEEERVGGRAGLREVVQNIVAARAERENMVSRTTTVSGTYV